MTTHSRRHFLGGSVCACAFPGKLRRAIRPEPLIASLTDETGNGTEDPQGLIACTARLRYGWFGQSAIHDQRALRYALGEALASGHPGRVVKIQIIQVDHNPGACTERLFDSVLGLLGNSPFESVSLIRLRPSLGRAIGVQNSQNHVRVHLFGEGNASALPT